MARDKNISPVGWYVGAYLLRFIEVNDPSNEDGEERFLSWENTVIVKAENMDEAYDKIEKIAKESTAPYLGGADAIPVQWVFEGITDILPIYEELEDGSEIMWSEHKPTKLKNLRKMVRRRGEFVQ
ncbi:DUF4288 domain-containing protein [Aquipseudomonas campi]|uniref:DUF4288 domain-containing protein n=1 Tax=Aquipseudomonas campi TaxID=2731681 RepID=A0A6M8FRD0_9GAMM|nr:DUF4288 domain-containing protein [Pseudomonas campi]QKE63321.1 DUF4288 domain-containing protein [Pseudomonas campi]QKE63328.1 DUF4288 domain-containing protein [Pseudomonas campi]